MKNLLTKIKKKNITVFVVGCGYTGLPLSKEISKNNIKTIAYDIDKKLILNLKKKIKNSNLLFTDNTKFISKANIILVCLPTPLTKNNDPDLSYITHFLNHAKKFMTQNQLLILESTTYPGTTNEILKTILNKKFIIGKNFFLGYSPERIDPGRNIEFSKITKICSGTTQNCRKLVYHFYKAFINKVLQVKNNETAEFVKIFENIFRSVNISLVNEMKIIADSFGVDIREIINAAATKPYGFMKFNPGPGIGGHCIPVDPFYLTWKAKEYGIHTRFIELAGEINNKIPEWTFNKMLEILNNHNIFIKKEKILIIGAAYKKNISDTRESPSLKIFKMLKMKKIKFDYHDPYVKKINHKNLKLKSVSLNSNNIKKYNICLILTDHDSIEYQLLEKQCKIIFDTRGVLKKSKKTYLI